MTEIQFLAQLLLNDSITGDLKKQIVDRISALEQQRQSTVPYVINTPYVGPVEICQHDFPQPWYGTVPPHCKKCGQQMYNPLVVTCGDYPRKAE